MTRKTKLRWQCDIAALFSVPVRFITASYRHCGKSFLEEKTFRYFLDVSISVFEARVTDRRLRGRVCSF